MFVHFINLTPHHLRVDGEIVSPSGVVARVATTSRKVVDLPAPQEGTEYIVAFGVARYATGRPDGLILATSRAEVVPAPDTVESGFARLKMVGIKTGMVPGLQARWGYGLILPDGGEVWLDDTAPDDGDIYLLKEEMSPAMWRRIIEASRGFEGAFLDEDGDLFVLPAPCSWDDSFVPVG